MNFDDIDLLRGSDITYSVRLWAREAVPYLSILHLTFAGNYRDGSSGAPDAHYMRGIISIAKGTWRPCAIILDLSELAYEWGDEMGLVLMPEGDHSAVVVGPNCREAISTLRLGMGTKQDIVELSNYFDDFNAACKYVAQRQVDRWNEGVNKMEFMKQRDNITLADFGIPD